MQALRLKYGEALPTKVEEIAAMCGRLRELAGETRQAAHRLRGTAGVFGFAAIGEAAGAIEDIVSQVLEEETGERGISGEALSDAAQTLREAMRAEDLKEGGEDGKTDDPHRAEKV